MLDLSQEIIATGVFDITAQAFNNGIRIGHFDASDTEGPFDFLGFQVAEPIPSTSDDIRIIADVYLSNGTRIGTATPFTITLNGDYTWRYEWSPATDRLTVEFFNSTGASVGTSELALSASEKSIGVSLNAFGLSTGGIGAVSPTNVADVFIDNVAYSTAVPEPSAILLIVSGGVCLFGVRKWRVSGWLSCDRSSDRAGETSSRHQGGESCIAPPETTRPRRTASAGVW